MPRSGSAQSPPASGSPRAVPDELVPAAGDLPPLTLRRSARRRKTVSARWQEDRVLLLIPAGMSTERARRHARELMPRLRRARAHAGGEAGAGRRSDAFLAARAQELARRLLGERVRPASIRWVTNQHSRWGSTTPAHGTVRISHHLWDVPDYVLDYVIHHELCHLLESSHNARFRRLEALYPQAERARAYLEGYAHGRARPVGQEPEDPCGESPEPSSSCPESSSGSSDEAAGPSAS